MLLTYKENVHSTQMYIPLKPLFSRHKGIGVQFTDEPTGNLDTASSIEIMELFTKLYQEGATVVLVTHEEDIAAFARRIICFGDGKILSDRINHPVWEKGDVHVSGKHDDGF